MNDDVAHLHYIPHTVMLEIVVGTKDDKPLGSVGLRRAPHYAACVGFYSAFEPPSLAVVERNRNTHLKEARLWSYFLYSCCC